MKYYKIADDAYILCIGKVETERPVAGEISEEEYTQLENVISSKPTASDGYFYRLTLDGIWKAEQWQEVEEWVD